MKRPGIFRCMLVSLALALSACGGGGDDEQSDAADSQPTPTGIDSVAWFSILVSTSRMPSRSR